MFMLYFSEPCLPYIYICTRIAVIVFGIVKANIPFKRTIKKANDNDELAQLIQATEN